MKAYPDYKLKDCRYPLLQHEKEIIDLRDLMMMINEKKQLNANLSLEFDCQIEVDDPKPLVKVINYAINYLTQLSDQQLMISLNAGVSGYVLAFTVATDKTEFPVINEQVPQALEIYKATIETDGAPGKYAQLRITIPEPEVQ